MERDIRPSLEGKLVDAQNYTLKPGWRRAFNVQPEAHVTTLYEWKELQLWCRIQGVVHSCITLLFNPCGNIQVVSDIYPNAKWTVTVGNAQPWTHICCDMWEIVGAFFTWRELALNMPCKGLVPHRKCTMS